MTQAPGFPEILSALDGAASVLDVGCGSGRLTLEVARRGAAVTGIDVSDGALATAREHASRTGLAVRFMHADMTRPLPFADAGFAAGVSRLALMVGAGRVRARLRAAGRRRRAGRPAPRGGARGAGDTEAAACGWPVRWCS